MWQYEHSAVSTVPPAAIWERWSDIPCWPEWNPGVSSIEADGALAEGTSFTMITPPDGEAITLTIIEAEPGISFTDRFQGDGFVIDTLHRVETTTQGGSRIVYRTRIVGPAADDVGPEIGPAITSDFPEVVTGLIEHASGVALPSSSSG